MKTRTFNLILAMVLFLLPFLWATSLLLGEGNARIAFSEKERTGLIYHHALFDLQLAFQRFRGKSYMVENDGNKDALLTDVRINVERTIRLTDETFSNHTIEGFSIHDEWKGIRQTLLDSIKDDKSATAEQAFKKRTEILEQLRVLMHEVANQSNLILDPQLPSYYMMNMIINIFPSGVEYVAHSRGLLSGMLNQESPLYLSLAKGYFRKHEGERRGRPSALGQEGPWESKVAAPFYQLSCPEPEQSPGIYRIARLGRNMS